MPFSRKTKAIFKQYLNFLELKMTLVNKLKRSATLFQLQWLLFSAKIALWPNLRCSKI